MCSAHRTTLQTAAALAFPTDVNLLAALKARGSVHDEARWTTEETCLGLRYMVQQLRQRRGTESVPEGAEAPQGLRDVGRLEVCCGRHDALFQGLRAADKRTLLHCIVNITARPALHPVHLFRRFHTAQWAKATARVWKDT